MEDTEVGELWRAAGEKYYSPTVISLIRKLVEERAGAYYYKDGNYATQWHELAHHGKAGEIVKQQYAGYALRDFGIDPAEYKEK